MSNNYKTNNTSDKANQSTQKERFSILDTDVTGEKHIPDISNLALEPYGASYVYFGHDNLFPQMLVDLYHNSPTHASIQNTKINLITAGDVDCPADNDMSIKEHADFKAFAKRVNRNDETLKDIYDKLTVDYVLFGGFCLEVIWTKDYSGIAEIYHKDFTKIRISQLDTSNQVKEYYYNFDWQHEFFYDTVKLKPFNKNKKQTKQLFYFSDYTPHTYFYPLPGYIDSLSWILLDKELADFGLNHIANGLSAGKMLSFNTGIPSEEEQRQIKRDFHRQFTGSKGSQLILNWNNSQDDAPTVNNLGGDNIHEQLEQINNLVVQNIITSNGLTSPQLAGIKTAGELSNSDLMQAQELFHNKVIKPAQDKLTQNLTKVLSVNFPNLDLDTKRGEVISEKFSEDTIRAVLTEDELRARLGYGPKDEAEQT